MKTDQPPKNPITLTGLVIASDWDIDGNPIGVYLAAFNDDEYLVENKRIVRELVHLIHKKVEITGYLRKPGRGPHVISAIKFKVESEAADNADSDVSKEFSRWEDARPHIGGTDNNEDN